MTRISPTLDRRPAPQVAKRLVHDAVHRYRPLSREGLSSGCSPLPFRVGHPQIWEDPAVDLAAMEISSDHHVVTIASGGCNVMSYLSASPAHITAVDLNRSHVALTRLKLAGIRHLPSWEAFYRFFGEADEAANIRAFRQHIEPHLDPETRAFWEGRAPPAAAASRSSVPISIGAVSSAVSSAPATASPSSMASTLANSSRRAMSGSSALFRQQDRAFFDKRLVRWLTRRPASLFGLGIPPARELLATGGGDIAGVLRARPRLACWLPAS